MSDINLDFGWQTIVVYSLMMAFWPLAGMTALLGFVYWLTRRGGDERKRRFALGALIVTAIPFAASAGGWAFFEGSQIVNDRSEQSFKRDHSRTLASPETIGKLRFPAGTIVEDDRAIGAPLQVTLAVPATISGIPTRDTLQVDPDAGLTGTIALTRTATIDGLTCARGDDIRFTGGLLTKCHLAKIARVNGVPCTGDLDRESTLQCTLAAPYRSHGILYGAGTDFTNFGTSTMAIVGTVPPDVRVLGKALPDGTIVRYDSGAVDVEMPLRSGGCEANDVYFDIGTRRVTAKGTGGCTVALPVSTFSFARKPTLHE